MNICRSFLGVFAVEGVFGGFYLYRHGWSNVGDHMDKDNTESVLSWLLQCGRSHGQGQ